MLGLILGGALLLLAGRTINRTAVSQENLIFGLSSFAIHNVNFNEVDIRGQIYANNASNIDYNFRSMYFIIKYPATGGFQSDFITLQRLEAVSIPRTNRTTFEVRGVVSTTKLAEVLKDYQEGKNMEALLVGTGSALQGSTTFNFPPVRLNLGVYLDKFMSVMGGVLSIFR